MKKICSLYVVFLFGFLHTQELKDFAIPKNYKKLLQVKGDLDKDGKPETLILFNTDKKITSDFNNGYIRELFILKNLNSGLKIWKKSSTVIFASTTSFYPENNLLPTIKITNNCIVITQQFNTNSRHTMSYKHTYRFQENDFYLIGSVKNFDDTCEFNIFNDVNFSTGKVVVDEQYYPCFDGEKAQEKDFHKEFIYKFKKSVKMDNFRPGENSIKIPDSDQYFNY